MPENDTNATKTKWQEKIGSKLLLWKDKLLQSGTELAYGTLCAAALLPALEAAQRGDFSLMGFLIGEISVNLIANQIQAIKDAGEAEAPNLLQTKAEEDPAIREELDRILEKLDVIELARGTMDEGERAAFFDQLKASLPKESLRIIEDRSVFVNGDSKYSIVSTGDGAHIEYHNHTHFHSSDALEVEKKNEAAARQNYLKQLYRHCQNLPLDIFGEEIDRAAVLHLEDVYIELATTTPSVGGEKGSLVTVFENDISKTRTYHNTFLAIEAAKLSDRMVLLGDPGSGKSTFAKHLLGQFCLAELGEIPPLEDFSSGLIPILINLRDLVPVLQKIQLPKENQKRKLALFSLIIDQVKKDVIHEYLTPEFAESLSRAISEGTCFLVLDGFDEVPQNLRGLVREAVAALLSFNPQRVLVTCRIRSYTGKAVLDAFDKHTLAPLEKDQIKKFCFDWYNRQSELTARVTASDAKTKAENLFQAITTDENLTELAENPMLLSTMAIVHQKNIHLPPERVLLFQDVVKILLFNWQEYHGDKHLKESIRYLLNDQAKLLRIIEHLAFIAHQAGQGDKEAADLPRKLARDIVEDEHLGSAQLAEDFLDYVDQRTGILMGRGGEPGKPHTYAFPHRFLQEYLAGCHINRQSQHAKLRLLAEIAGEGDYWDVVFQLAIEERFHIGEDPDLVTLAADICTFCDDSSENGHRMVYWSALLEKLLGEKAIQDYDDPAHHITIGREYLSTLRGKLLTVATGIKLTPVERAEAADTLDSLGYVPDDLYTFVKIPGDEKIATFWMGKYPVINRQYARFLTPENFADQSLWVDLPDLDAQGQPVGTLGDEAWRWLQEEIKDKDILMPKYWDDPDIGQTRPGAPVVGVSWYEAMAYGRWVKRRWAGLAEFDQNSGPKPKQVRLPAEAEWEKAVGGTAGDRYAWDKLGEHTDPEKLITCANTVESGIGRTTPVWTYPQGRSHPYGLWDVSGNVWKWQANRDESGSRRRGVRGGSFSLDLLRARCAFRFRNFPGGRGDYLGFRLCLRP